MSDTQNEPLPGEKAIKVKKAGPILSGADRYDIFEKGQKAIREFVEELFRFLIDFPGMMCLVFILTVIVAGENRDKELMLEELAVLMNTSQYTVEIHPASLGDQAFGRSLLQPLALPCGLRAGVYKTVEG